MRVVSNWPVQALRVSSPLTTLKLFFFFFFSFFFSFRGEYTLRIYTVATFIDARPGPPNPDRSLHLYPLSSSSQIGHGKRLNLTSYFSIIPGTRPYITHLDTQAESSSESQMLSSCSTAPVTLETLDQNEGFLDFSMELKYTISNLFTVSLSSCELLFPQLDWQIRSVEAAKLYIYVRVIVNPVSECSAVSKSDGVSS